MARTVKLVGVASVERLDEMCTTCWRCALVRLTVHILRPDGVSERVSEYCAGCRADKERGYE
jgi:hypothetical protein